MRATLSIAVVGGTGQEGSGLALRLARAGHKVVIGSRDAGRAAARAAELRGRLEQGEISGAGNLEAASASELVILTVPYSAQKPTVKEIEAALQGKVLVDATAPLVAPRVSQVQLPETGSAVAAVQRMLGERVRVVSAFQNVSAHHLSDLSHEVECDVLVCGDDRAACEVVIALARDIGLRAFHAGPICNSAAAEALTSILISINRRYKAPGSGIRITGVAADTAPAAARN
ncbi:MAG TPA: NADPH-dependent F420 reductase [Xanthobacteraceae bacterium]